MHTANIYDVVISGAGMAGSALAHALSGSGLKVALLDAGGARADARASFDDRAIALAWNSRKVLESLGLWQHLQAEAEPIKQVHISDRGHFGFARLHHQDVACEALGYVVPARVLGTVLHTGLSALDGIDLIAAAELSGFQRIDGLIQLHIKTAEQAMSLQTRLLLAADGDRSLIREQGGFRLRDWHYDQAAVVCNVQTALPHQQIAYERFAGKGPLAMLPMSQNRSAMVWTVPQTSVADVLQMNDSDFIQASQKRFGFRLGRFQRVGQRHSYPLSMRVVEKPAQAGIILLGNAAHTLHPVAGQGFNLGLRDVAAVHELLLQHGSGDAAIGAESMMQAYLQQRQLDLQLTGVATDMLVRLFTNPLSPLKMARNGALLALDLIPGLRSGVARAGMGLLGRSSLLSRGMRHEI
ncbi:MAG: 2-octaprenyl-6-methoxyphenyl hydroxylase [gamma proteobacterium symbiont of Bathyaustriella thionipta]|nr:2-octaprenyl-6-methoxyphenyl hydroxylase [gamma proteobacterium symbiont of Bathyaustriella thionipta]